MCRKPMIDGGRCAAVPSRAQLLLLQNRKQILKNFLLSVDYSGTMIVCKVLPGSAKVVARLLPSVTCPDIIGVVGGNDTIFVTVNSPDNIERVIEAFYKIWDGKK